VDVQSSIGVAWFPECDDETSAESTISRADLAMYQAKSEGGGIRLFEQSMRSYTRRRLSLEHELRSALDRDGFELFLQPQHRLADDGFAGAEALIRWESPSHGPVSPAEFVPLAEEAGLIVGLGDWVFDSTLAVMRHWLDLGLALPEHGFAVNVSPHQFHLTDFVDRITRGLRRHNVPPEMLMLEITESAVIDNIDDTVEKMHALREHGIKFAMDDFGTGYSSLTQLHQLPLDTLKIDRAFITSIHHTPLSATIVDTILDLAGSMGLYVVAEGVETEEERNHLARRDCETYQGFLRARPMGVAAFFEHVRTAGHGGGPPG
jgi:EAL domain-containing protein (putative c-di-GMP-specific phosphodiesterase class I)